MTRKHANQNKLPIGKAIFNGILISGVIIPFMFLIFIATGLVDLTFLFGGTIIPEYELVCFDPDRCFLKIEDTWYIITGVASPGSIPPELQQLEP